MTCQTYYAMPKNVDASARDPPRSAAEAEERRKRDALREAKDAWRAKDAAELAAAAKDAGGVDALLARPILADIKGKCEANKFAYSRYDAIGLFRMLEL